MMPHPVAFGVRAVNIDPMDARRTVKFVGKAVAVGTATGCWVGMTYASAIVMGAGFDMHARFPNTHPSGTTDAWFVLGGMVGLCVAFAVLFAVAKKLVSPKPTPRLR